MCPGRTLPTMQYALLGWPEDGPTLELDHELFPYAGKFRPADTGKAVAREDGTVLGAVAFSPDRTDADTLQLRYVTVRRDRQGEGIGPRLVRFVADRAGDRGFARVEIGVNNPHAYVAAYRAGFAFTGEETGMAELVLADGGDRGAERYRDGLAIFAERELPPKTAEFVTARLDEGVPDVVDVSSDVPR